MVGDLEKSLKEAREKNYLPLRTKDSNGKLCKSDGEKEQEAKDKKTLDETVRRRTFEKAIPAFYGPNQGVRNPWRDEIANTMFWM